MTLRELTGNENDYENYRDIKEVDTTTWKTN